MVCSLTLIQPAAAQDSVKVSNSDARVFLKEHENYPRVVAIADSIAKEYQNCQTERQNDNAAARICDTLSKTQAKAIKADSSQNDFYKSELKHANRWRVIWRAVADVTGITAATEFVILYFKKP